MDEDNIALFDMDGTLVDYDTAMLADLESLRSDHEPPLTFERMHDLPGPWEARRKLIVQKPGWWLKLRPLEVGMWLFDQALKVGFNPNILTKGPRHCPNAWKEKVEWCHQELFRPELVKSRTTLTTPDELDIHVVSAKSLVYGKVLVDDFPPYVESWLRHRPRGLVLLPHYFYNRDFQHPNVVRCGDPTDSEWKKKARAALETAFFRRAGEPLVLDWRKKRCLI
jgi:hypothetical protein